MYIAVIPEKLDEFSSRLKRLSGSLQDIERRLQRELNRLDWETRQKPGIQGNWHRVQKLAQNNISEAESMASFLAQRAHAFKEADRQGVNSLSNLAGRFTSVIQSIMQGAFGAVISFPSRVYNGLMNLGGITGGALKIITAPFALTKVGGSNSVTLSTALPTAVAIIGTAVVLQKILGPAGYVVISSIIKTMRKDFQGFGGGSKGAKATTPGNGSNIGNIKPINPPKVVKFKPIPVDPPDPGAGGRIQNKTDPQTADLVTIKGHGGINVKLHKLAEQAWEAMLVEARDAGLEPPLLEIESGYRSTKSQKALWENALKQYGSPEKADDWVAPPGNSAHHSGRAIDFYMGMKNSSKNVDSLRKTPAYEWLAANAERFGFYPYNKEPWHWEYNPR